MSSEMWATRSLGDLTYNYDSQRIPVKEADRHQGPYPYYGASGIVDYIDKYIFEGEYLLIAEDGENLRTRKTPIAFMARGKYWVNNHAHIVQGNEMADTNFLLYSLLNADVSAYLTGSTMPKLTQGNLNRIQLLMPCLPEQRAIAATLSALDAKIELNNRINKTLEEMAQALFKRWFVDFEFPDENGQPYKSSGGELEESGLGLIPKGWIASNVFDHVCERKQRNSDNKLLPVLSVVKEGKFVTSEEFFSKQVYSKDTSKYKVIRKNDVGYNPSRANIGSIAMLREFDEGLLSPIYVIFSFDEMIMPYFFAYYMKRPGFIEKIAHHSSGTTRQNFNFEALKDFEIVIPPTIIQEKAFDSINEIEKHIESLLTQNEALIQLRDTLLPKLMSGEIRVPIEEVAADV